MEGFTPVAAPPLPHRLPSAPHRLRLGAIPTTTIARLDTIHLVIANGSPVAPAAALPAETVSPSNPHRRQPPTRRPAGSFLGAFGRRPSARATSNDGPASETLHQSGSSTG